MPVRQAPGRGRRRPPDSVSRGCPQDSERYPRLQGRKVSTVADAVTRIYMVTVTREGKWWMVHIPELDGLTQARNLGEVEAQARDYIAVWLDVPADSFAVHV